VAVDQHAAALDVAAKEFTADGGEVVLVAGDVTRQQTVDAGWAAF
jgi:hypothetical protein